LLKAQHPPDSKPSTTLAQKALQEKRMLLWPCADEVIKTKPPSLKQVAYAIYAPLLWRGQALGVLCLDTGEEGGWPFTSNVAQLVEALAVPLAYFVANLRLSEALHGQEEKHKALERLVPKEALERLGRHQNRIKLGGEIREVTVLFSDLRGFTNLSKDMRSDDVADFLEAYFGKLVPVIAKHGGTIDKFVGDAILAVFGSSIKGMQAEAAVDAALEMQAEIKALNKARSQAGKPVGELGIGLHCGTVMHGFIGTLERAEFTVIGDTVNRASRYCDGAGRGEVLISPDVFALVWRAYETERTAIPTKHEGELKAYRVKSKVK
jgi:class 3 adenylate cyclase